MKLTKVDIILEDATADIQSADTLAAQAHAGQTRRGGESYIDHPRKVQSVAKQLGYGIDIQIIALLHDAVEDSKTPEKIKQTIEKRFGPDILNAILWLTHESNASYENYLLSMSMSTERSATRAFKVKMIDMYLNMTDNPTKKQKEKYTNALYKLMQHGYKDMIPQQLLDLLEIKEMLTEASKDAPKKDDAPLDAPKGNEPSVGGDPAKSGGGGDPFASGGGSVGDPFADAGGPGGPGDAGEGDEKENGVFKYNEKSASMQKMKFSREDPEPGFDFSKPNPKFYDDNYVSKSKNGSLMLAVPSVKSNNDTGGITFIKSHVIGKILESIKAALKNQKRVVLIGNYGLPFDGEKYQNNEQGLIAKYLDGKFPKGYVLFDTWNPKDFKSFVSNTKIWKDLKERTDAKGSEIKAAMYLNAVAMNNKDVQKQLNTPDVQKLCKEWGVDLEAGVNADLVLKTAHPEWYDEEQTLVSLIINTYEYLLRVTLFEKVHRYELKGTAAIVPIDQSTAWVLKDSFEKMEEMKPGASEEEPEDEAGDSGSEKEEKPKEKEKKS